MPSDDQPEQRLVLRPIAPIRVRLQARDVSVTYPEDQSRPGDGSQKSFPIVPAVLIENAIKYGVSGTLIRVEVAASGGNAVISVENASKEAIDPIECFKRGVRFSRAAEGGGFGLYLAKEIVAAHGGVIECERREHTVLMRVTLPLKTVIAPPKKVR